MWGGFFQDETGQDVVEYALLVAFFGVALIAAWSGVVDALQSGHESVSTGAEALWDPPEPGGSPP
jgi:Flp pilus assembly pilin Flp